MDNSGTLVLPGDNEKHDELADRERVIQILAKLMARRWWKEHQNDEMKAKDSCKMQ